MSVLRSGEGSRMPGAGELITVFAGLAASSWRGVVYRAVTPRYANGRDLVSGEGAAVHGARWNPRGSFPVVYGSLEPETAMAESLAHHRHYGIPVQNAMPLVFAAIDVELSRVVDVEGALAALKTDAGAVVASDWPGALVKGVSCVTHEIGVAAHGAGLEAILVPSAAVLGSQNIAIFPRNLRAGSRVQVLGVS